MTALVDRLLPLWTRPVRAREDPRAAFAEVYADPVVVNGTAMTITELVDRARSLQQAFDRLGMDIVDTVEAPGRIVIAFIMRGRHVGPYLSSLGTVAPTHRDIEVRTIDVLTISNGLISAIWVVSDDLALLRQLGAAQLTPARHPGLLDSSRHKRTATGPVGGSCPGIRRSALCAAAPAGGLAVVGPAGGSGCRWARCAFPQASSLLQCAATRVRSRRAAGCPAGR